MTHPPFATIEPPAAPREPKDVSVHGDLRIDDWFWLRVRDDPRTLAYLQAENDYAEAWFAPHAGRCEKLYQEMYARIQQDDDSVPYRKAGWWYSSRTRAGEQYPRLLRRKAIGSDRRYDASGNDETLLDLNALAAGHAFLRLGLAAVSPDGERLAYSLDRTGGLDYTLHLKNLVTGETDAWTLPEVDSAAWASDSRTLFYVTMDESKRGNRLWRHVPGASEPATLLYEEADELFRIGVRTTLDQRFLVLDIDSADSTEVRVADAAAAATADGAGFGWRTVFARRPDVVYSLDHRAGSFYLRINDTGRNFRLIRVDASAPDLAAAEELIAAREHVMLDDVDLFRRHLVVTERVSGNLQLRIFDLIDGGERPVGFDEAVYSVHSSGNAEFDTPTLRFVYTSLTTPSSTWDLDLLTGARELKKRQPVPGYDPALYASARVVASAADGTAVPVSLVWRKDKRQSGAQPLLLYGYGAYGLPLDPYFSQTRVSLLDRGVIFAIAHVRGGGDLGRSWYEAARMATKALTFSDFVSCAEALVAQGFTTPAQLAIQGGSAGGLLMGAVVNLRPELFKAVLAQVPFVDVVNTMLDETLPLTVGEFKEWGNPKLPEQYAWIRAWSPYDNLVPGAYPAMLVRSGLNDSQVAYWEPAKYVARLRTLKTDDRPLLFKIDLKVGHGGSSGRFDALREVAEDQVFLLAQLGVGD